MWCKVLKLRDTKFVNVVAAGSAPYEEVLKGSTVALEEYGRRFGGRKYYHVTEVDKTNGDFHNLRFRFFLKKNSPSETSTDIVVVVSPDGNGGFNYNLQP